MLLSLGHSCQTRFIIDAIDPSSRRMPFDFNITSRPALIRALETDGASLRHDEGNATVFSMPVDGRQGLDVGGLYFWHDYPLAEDRLRLADGWQRDIARVNEKYAALWSRLSTALRSDEPKTLALSNSQHNLGQFAADDVEFTSHFGLGRHAFDTLVQALDAHGARNYRLLLLTRSVDEFAETASLADPRLDHRFVGILSLRPDPRVAGSLQPEETGAGIARLAGVYGGGAWKIEARSPRVAIVHQDSGAGFQPHGSITLTGERHIAWLEGRDRFTDIVFDDGEIRFPDGSRWRRD
jgi:hypothetical protein